MTKVFPIAPSILSADFSNLGAQLREAENAGINMLHVDVMDRHFVPNLTFGSFLLPTLRKAGIQSLFDVHLMVDPVEPLIHDFIKAGANRISFHPEATFDLNGAISLVKKANCDVGIALNPDQNMHRILPILSQLDFILIMSVYPGFSGQKFIEPVKDKIKECRQFLDRHHPTCRIQVDGGVSLDNISELIQLGADHFVMGSAFFSDQNFETLIKACRHKLFSK